MKFKLDYQGAVDENGKRAKHETTAEAEARKAKEKPNDMYSDNFHSTLGGSSTAEPFIDTRQSSSKWYSGRKSSTVFTSNGDGNPRPIHEARSTQTSKGKRGRGVPNWIYEDYPDVKCESCNDDTCNPKSNQNRNDNLRSWWKSLHSGKRSETKADPRQVENEFSAFRNEAKNKGWNKREILQEGAKRFHPDRHNDDPAYTKAMQDVVSLAKGW